MNSKTALSNMQPGNLLIQNNGGNVSWCYRTRNGHLKRGNSLNRQAAIAAAEIASRERALTWSEIEYTDALDWDIDKRGFEMMIDAESEGAQE